VAQQSAKRFGLDVQDDLELEVRLRRMEAKLSRKADANLDATVTSGASDVVPQVTGLRKVGSNPGTVTVAWNAVVIPDLRRYELNFAEDLAFSTNAQTVKIATTQYQLSTISATGGAGDTALYVRVRAVNVAGTPGVWSVVLNTATGQVQTDDLADDSVTADKVDDDLIASKTFDELYDDLALQEGLKGEIAGLELSVPSAGAGSQTNVTISAGSTTRFKQWLTSTLTKDLSSNWAVGDTNGGLATGSAAADTWYYVFLILNSGTSVVDAGFDTSLTAVNLLAASGYDKYRLLGAVKTKNASTDLHIILQDEEQFRWETSNDADTYTTNPGRATRTTYTLDVPPLVRVQAVVHAAALFNDAPNPGEQCALYFTDLGMTDTTLDVGAVGAVGNALGQISGQRIAANSSFVQGEVRIMTNTSGQIGISGEDTNDTTADDFIMRVHGWNWLGLRGPVDSDSN
jgi:hypothetical protein